MFGRKASGVQRLTMTIWQEPRYWRCSDDLRGSLLKTSHMSPQACTGPITEEGAKPQLEAQLWSEHDVLLATSRDRPYGNFQGYAYPARAANYIPSPS